MRRCLVLLSFVLAACGARSVNIVASGDVPVAVLDVPPTTPVDVPPTMPVDVPPTPVACPPPVLDPPRDTNCSAPTPVNGRVPYFQCTSEMVCPRDRFVNVPARPGFRVTYLRITAPVALSSAAILSTLNPTLARGTFLWGITLDTATSTLRSGGLHPSYARGSVGVGLMDGRFAFYRGDGPSGSGERFDPLASSFRVAGNVLTTTTPNAAVQLPVYSDEAGTALLTVLPLSNVRITAQLTPDRGCIGGGVPSGGRYTETTSRWLTDDGCDEPYGSVDADITVERARMTSVTIGGSFTPLCNIISGANCATDPQTGWPRQPDAMVDGQPAYHLRASFAAISANIAR